jgi:hypothetical protein
MGSPRKFAAPDAQRLGEVVDVAAHNFDAEIS